MKRSAHIWIYILLLSLLACRQGARSNQCFDDILRNVEGRTANEVQKILGEPDSRQQMAPSGELWVWWNYTYLDGKDYPPEERGKVVHLQINFDRLSRDGEFSPQGELRVRGPLSVSYTPSGKI